MTAFKMSSDNNTEMATKDENEKFLETRGLKQIFKRLSLEWGWTKPKIRFFILMQLPTGDRESATRFVCKILL